MGFRVKGELDDTLYDVTVTGNSTNPITGSARVSNLFTQFDGEIVLATPNGPKYQVNGSDPASVLALLSSKSKVTSVVSGDDDAPRLVDSLDPGAVR